MSLRWGDNPPRSALEPAAPVRAFEGRAPWSLTRTFLGIGGNLALYLLTGILTIVVAYSVGADPVAQDAEDIFEVAGKVAQYTDELLQATALGEQLPDPPALEADVVVLRIGFGFTLAFQAATVGLVVWLSGRGLRNLAQDLRLSGYRWQTAWQPAVAMAVAYAGVIGYALVAEAIGVDALVPRSTVPAAVTEDPWTLALAGVAAVIAAPISEELFFRGFVFGGFLRWGFVPAAALSAFMFSAVHLDPGSLIPFFWVGMVLAWMFWRRGTLWDSLLFHAFFNGFSFILLVSTGG